MKKLSTDFSIVVRVYGIGVLFSFGQTQERLLVVAKKNGFKEKDMHLFDQRPNIPGWCVHDNSTRAVVVLRDWPLTASDYGCLNHEIFHACDFTLRNIGFILSDDSKEAWAYMVGYVTAQVYNVLWSEKYKARTTYWQKQLKKKK